MYTAVLMAALSTSPATQAWWPRGGGCCWRGGCAGSCASTSHGCSGYSGGHGWANGYGGMGYSGCSCSYGCFAPPAYAPVCSATFQCPGWYAGGGYGLPFAHAVPSPAPPSDAPAQDQKPAGKGGYERAPAPKERKPSEEQVRARVIIDLPADAKLYVDGKLMASTSERRMFQTPNLIRGQLYYYELRAEVIRDGHVVREEQKVLLRAGDTTTASFAELGRPRAVTAARAE